MYSIKYTVYQIMLPLIFLRLQYIYFNYDPL